jgi:hypothetical protein
MTASGRMMKLHHHHLLLRHLAAGLKALARGRQTSMSCGVTSIASWAVCSAAAEAVATTVAVPVAAVGAFSPT